ncbi:hypothetical protein G6O69_20555 [Pseudenhygromyxa sp. WMMC2535]|uniref:hypothetical protein n=1 Tax=Pseudenhygromyxa sp. WMMC2535 TaxID=2712867 RepID=UPI001554D540|nr:hypothetical protein [Pseudenhygromyxa sp. WMMC2535]NVB40246.1 hypothetical protein [Pseudenhygromyxa sp. WMMC2535]
MRAHSRELPQPAPSLENAALLGAWYVLISNRSIWRARSHPRIEYIDIEAGPGGDLLHTELCFRRQSLRGMQRKLLSQVDEVRAPGCFRRKGSPFSSFARTWSVPLLDPERRWAVAYFASSGLDLLSRDPVLPQATLDAVLSQVRAHPFLGQAPHEAAPLRCGQLYAPAQDWRPPSPYRLG